MIMKNSRIIIMLDENQVKLLVESLLIEQDGEFGKILKQG